MDQRKLMQGLMARIAVGVFGLLIVAMLLLAVFNDGGALSVHDRYEKLAEIKAEIASLNEQNQQLRKRIDSLRNDPKTIEKLAREELRLVKPGEVVLVTPEPKLQK